MIVPLPLGPVWGRRWRTDVPTSSRMEAYMQHGFRSLVVLRHTSGTGSTMHRTQFMGRTSRREADASPRFVRRPKRGGPD